MRLMKKVLLVDDLTKVTVTVYLVTGQGKDGCRVGFAPRHLMKYMLEYNGVLARVKEVHSCHDNSSPIKRRKVHQNHGFAVAVLDPNLIEKKRKNNNDSLPKPPSQKKMKKVKGDDVPNDVTVIE